MTLREMYELKKEENVADCVKLMGWSENYAPAEEIYKKTMSLLKDIRVMIGSDDLENSELWNEVKFEGKNMRDAVYGKSFDRMVFRSRREAVTVIYNMTGSGAKYLIFEYGKATPIAKVRSRKNLIDFLKQWIEEQ